MSDHIASYRGVLRYQGPSTLLGRAMIWTISNSTSAGLNVWDGASPGAGKILGAFSADGTVGAQPAHYIYPQGLPVEVGIATSGTCVITYSPLT
jgi:hypothetical protein